MRLHKNTMGLCISFRETSSKYYFWGATIKETEDKTRYHLNNIKLGKRTRIDLEKLGVFQKNLNDMN